MKSTFYLNRQSTINILPFITILLLGTSCGNGVSGDKYDLKGFQMESIGGGANFAEWISQNNGKRLAAGTTYGEVRTGAWMTYHTNTNQIETITNYINGKKNGPTIKLNDRGQIEELAEYKNDVLHGMVVKYRFGKPVEELTYANGVLNGHFAVYDNQFKIQKKGSFKNGKQDGLLQFFNENGQITMEYTYKDGEKISGGIVEVEQ